jgi:hypothetical protein
VLTLSLTLTLSLIVLLSSNSPEGSIGINACSISKIVRTDGFEFILGDKLLPQLALLMLLLLDDDPEVIPTDLLKASFMLLPPALTLEAIFFLVDLLLVMDVNLDEGV